MTRLLGVGCLALSSLMAFGCSSPSSGGNSPNQTTGTAGQSASPGSAGIGGGSGPGDPSGLAGNAGSGGAAGRGGGTPGFDCYTIGQCKLGDACVRCSTTTYLCVPDPDHDPDGYAAATAGCPALGFYGVCDGPEDCHPGESCVYVNEFPRAFRCSPEPAPEPIDCEIYNFPQAPSCTFCWTNADCPTGQHCGSPLLTSGASGCLKDPSP